MAAFANEDGGTIVVGAEEKAHVLARFTPEPWQPLDTLSFARYLAFSLSPNWESELVRSRLISRLGYAVAATLEQIGAS